MSNYYMQDPGEPYRFFKPTLPAIIDFLRTFYELLAIDDICHCLIGFC